MLEAEGLTEHEPNRGARVPSLSMHEVDVIYRMRERLETLAIAESPLFTVYLPSTRGGLDDRVESWFLTSPKPVTAPSPCCCA